MPTVALILPGPGPQDRSSAKTREDSMEAFSKDPTMCTLLSTMIAKTMVFKSYIRRFSVSFPGTRSIKGAGQIPPPSSLSEVIAEVSGSIH